jgi:hypothetical protein
MIFSRSAWLQANFFSTLAQNQLQLVTFVPTEVALVASNETAFLSNNCSSTERARTLKFESFKELKVNNLIITVSISDC